MANDNWQQVAIRSLKIKLFPNPIGRRPTTSWPLTKFSEIVLAPALTSGYSVATTDGMASLVPFFASHY